MQFAKTLVQQQIVDYRARAGAGAGAVAAILTSWSRSRAKMERLLNTDVNWPVTRYTYKKGKKGKENLQIYKYLIIINNPEYLP